MICIFRRNRVTAPKTMVSWKGPRIIIWRLFKTKDSGVFQFGRWGMLFGLGFWTWEKQALEGGMFHSSFGVSRATAKWKSEPGHPTREKFTSSSNLRNTEPNRTTNELAEMEQSIPGPLKKPTGVVDKGEGGPARMAGLRSTG